jgi:CHASE2 domain-containing sensor protein
MSGDTGVDEMLALQSKVNGGGGEITQPWSPELVIYLSTAILLVTALALILGSILMWKRANSSQDILRLYGVVIIVGLSALLLVTGFSNEQLTPIVGLFGAMAGYLLGKESKSSRDE